MRWVIYDSLVANEVYTFPNIGHFVSKNYFAYTGTYAYAGMCVCVCIELVQIPLNDQKKIKFYVPIQPSNSRKTVFFSGVQIFLQNTFVV